MNRHTKVLLVFIIIIVLALAINTEYNKSIAQIENEKVMINETLKQYEIHPEDNYESVELKEKTFDNLAEFDIDEFEVKAPEGSELGSFTMFDDKLYYSVLYIEDMANYATAIRLYCLDTKTNDTTLLYELKAEELFVNELKSSESTLYWVEIIADKKWTICSLDLKDKSKDIIRSSLETNTNIPVCLSISSGYLSWYESSNENDDIDIKLMLYNNMTKEVIEAFEDVLILSPFDRASIDKNVITFLTQEDDEILINSSSLTDFDRKTIKIPHSSLLKVKSNENFTVWHDKFGVSEIYVKSNHETFMIDSDDINVFSIDLIDKYLIVNDRVKKNLFTIDLEKKEIINITQHLNNDSNSYVMASVSADGMYIAQNITENATKYIRIKMKDTLED